VKERFHIEIIGDFLRSIFSTYFPPIWRRWPYQRKDVWHCVGRRAGGLKVRAIVANELSDYGWKDDVYRMMTIFHPNALDKTIKAARSRQRFVYYTTAQTAVNILRSGEIWMRKSHLMNDYSEIEHGFRCLNNAYQKNKSFMQSVFDGMFPGFCARLEELFNAWLPLIRGDTYIACLSEHDASDDKYGRLSMWRAYGGAGPARVALVISGGPLIRPSDALKAYSSPVSYFSDAEVEQQFVQIIANVGTNFDFLKSLGEEAIRNHMFTVFRSAVVATKHPGFLEEREWRVVYSPSFLKSDRVTSSIETIDGTPQVICRLPLQDFPEQGLTGLNVRDFLDRAIIGPSKYPAGIYDALLNILREAKIENPETKIVVSDVPLRN
jgi:hypothetical protein